jgi:uncharacterized membrane protein
MIKKIKNIKNIIDWYKGHTSLKEEFDLAMSRARNRVIFFVVAMILINSLFFLYAGKGLVELVVFLITIIHLNIFMIYAVNKRTKEDVGVSIGLDRESRIDEIMREYAKRDIETDYERCVRERGEITKRLKMPNIEIVRNVSKKRKSI